MLEFINLSAIYANAISYANPLSLIKFHNFRKKNCDLKHSKWKAVNIYHKIQSSFHNVMNLCIVCVIKRKFVVYRTCNVMAYMVTRKSVIKIEFLMFYDFVVE